MNIVVVTGGRKFTPTLGDLNQFLTILAEEFPPRTPITIRHGGAGGLDSAVDAWLRDLRNPALVGEIWMPDWPRFGRMGPDNAGYRRNTAMLSGSTEDLKQSCVAALRTAGIRADLCVPFPGRNGTRHCRESALELGIKVRPILTLAELATVEQKQIKLL